MPPNSMSRGRTSPCEKSHPAIVRARGEKERSTLTRHSAPVHGPFRAPFLPEQHFGDARVIGLGPNGVQFAVDLLAKEIERASHSIRAIQIFPEAPQMRAEAGGLFGNVTALGKDCDFFEQSFIVEIQFKSRLTQALM